MKENKTSEKIKKFANRKWDIFADWFTDKEHPHSRLNKNVFFHDLLKLVGLILVFLIIYSNVDKINQIVLIFIKLGSLLQLVLLFFILRKAWHLTINLKYAFRGLNHGTKAIIAIVIVLLLFMAFLNQDKVVNSITQTYEEANFSKLNPIQVSGNFSLGDFSFFSTTPKTTYYCSEQKEKCKTAMKVCEEAILFEEDSSIDLKITISKKSTTCNFYYKVENSFISQFEGKSMTCEIPLSKLDKRPDDMDNLKYCKGSLKDTMLAMVGQFFGFG
ncbi:MAG: hypothetical protein KC516_04755 [Nanoarchaeota archaeon]|nr:hypothetical protein [Nanoarchaeota archaeon]